MPDAEPVPRLGGVVLWKVPAEHEEWFRSVLPVFAKRLEGLEFSEAKDLRLLKRRRKNNRWKLTAEEAADLDSQIVDVQRRLTRAKKTSLGVT